MTEPVIGISGLQGTGRKTERSGIYKKGKGDWHVLSTEKDSVDISEEARRRSAEERSEDKPENSDNEAEG
ncbi:MAG: hypothetical protein WCP33_03880 [Deltaproteobacteria bacterium]